MTLASSLLAGGLVLGVLGAMADNLGLQSTAGFGAFQIVGMLVGGICVLAGALLHADVVAMAGTAVFCLAICGDLLDIGASPGMGAKQVTAIVLAVLLLVVGLALNVQARRSRAAGASPTSETNPKLSR